eukprot:GILI01024498.1.p1 GENE.GILI01024498.1~~GILI01024498.1.p1  ORF type:complete len:180 (-),score=22.48 GILI01024498.1:95-634(-)
MGIKFEANFLLVAWAFVPALMFFTKVFRMDAKERHALDMRMKHHSSFWVKGNMFVEGMERVVLAQAGEEALLRGIQVADAENAEMCSRQRKALSSSVDVPITRIGSSKASKVIASQYASGLLTGAELSAPSLTFGGPKPQSVAADSSILLIPDSVWSEAEKRHKVNRELRAANPVSLSY